MSGLSIKSLMLMLLMFYSRLTDYKDFTVTAITNTWHLGCISSYAMLCHHRSKIMVNISDMSCINSYVTIKEVITRKPLHYQKTNDQLESHNIEMS